jgi:hypothetical protein
MIKAFLVIAGTATVALVAGASSLGSAELTSPGTIKVSTRGVERQFVDREPRGRSARLAATRLQPRHHT